MARYANSFFLSCVSVLLLSAPIHAQTSASPRPAPIPQNSEQPLEISADKALEWDRAGKKYFARGNAVAKQGDMQVQADTLVAEYRDGPKGETEIYRFTAEGHVILTSGGNKAYGDRAVYEIDDGKAVLTGGNLRIEGEQMTLTAKERFEYYSNEGRMVAIGAPVIKNQDSTLSADKITAWTADQSSGDNKQRGSQLKNLKRAEAEGHVVITTPREKATADKGIYTGENDTVELLGKVKLHQGVNTLEGVRAEMNLTTNLSKIYGDPNKGGRVKGVFFPGSQKKP